MNILEFIPKPQLEAVFSQEICDIDEEFMGFMDAYENLAKIIPEHFTVIDFGCAYAPQCFYFQNHKLYVGVDVFSGTRFYTKNTLHISASIEDYLNSIVYPEDTDEMFAICNYVPDFRETELVRSHYKNVFCFYPSNKELTKTLFSNFL